MKKKDKNETIAGQCRKIEKYLDNHENVSSDSNEIKLSLQNIDEIYDKYSGISEPKINEDIFSYLERAVRFIPVEKNVKINVVLPQNGGMDLPYLQEMIKKAVQQRNDILNHELQVNMKIFLILTLFGLIAFLFEAFIANHINIETINELALIVCWVFIWKAVETYFFERRKLKIQKKKLMQLYLADFNLNGER